MGLGAGLSRATGYVETHDQTLYLNLMQWFIVHGMSNPLLTLDWALFTVPFYGPCQFFSCTISHLIIPISFSFSFFVSLLNCVNPMSNLH